MIAQWRLVLVALLGVGAAAFYLFSPWPPPPSAGPTPSISAGSLRADQWRWAEDKETYDVYMPTPCPWQVTARDAELFKGKESSGPCERIAPWFLWADGRERRAPEVEWVRVHRGDQAFWMPARSDLDPARVVVFDGFEAHMAPVPASGKNLGTIVVKER